MTDEQILMGFQQLFGELSVGVVERSLRYKSEHGEQDLTLRFYVVEVWFRGRVSVPRSISLIEAL